MAYLMMLGWGLLLIGMSHLTKRMWSRMLGRTYRVLALPGILVHEISHALGCLLTGARITGFGLFEPGEGYVEHEPPTLPILGAPLISLAPIAACGAALWCVARLFGITGFGSAPLPDSVSFSPAGLGAFAEGFFGTTWHHAQMLWNTAALDIRLLVALYLGLALAVALGPSRQDLRNAALGVAAWAGLTFVAHSIARALGRPQGLSDVLVKPLWPALSGLVAIMCLLLAATAALCLVLSLLKRVFRREKRSEGSA